MSEGESFGDLLRNYRAAAHLTQEELAERSGVSAQAISMLERGSRRAPRVTTVDVLAEALELDAPRRALLIAAARPRSSNGSAPPEPVRSNGAGPGHAAEPAPAPSRSCHHAANAPPARGWLRAHRWLIAGPVAVVALAAAAVVAAQTLLPAGPFHQGATSPAPATSLPLCTAGGHPAGCWATVVRVDAVQDNPCPGQVPLYTGSTGYVCLNGNQLVKITCYYVGKPATGGDSVQDHVVLEQSGALHHTGHIPNRYVDLHGAGPSRLGVRTCDPPAPAPAPS